MAPLGGKRKSAQNERFLLRMDQLRAQNGSVAKKIWLRLSYHRVRHFEPSYAPLAQTSPVGSPKMAILSSK